jgi:hypothetical protein
LNAVKFHRKVVVDLADDYHDGRVNIDQFLASRDIEVVGRQTVLLNETITATVRNKLWDASLRRYVERPEEAVRAELAEKFTPRQINSTRCALGIRVVMREDGRWWQPHPSWPRPEIDPNAPVILEIRERGGTVSRWPQGDLEPWGYYWRD